LSPKNIASLKNNVVAQAPVKRGAGVAGTTAVVTTTVVKDQALPTVTAVTPVATRNGGFVVPVATAGNFDRTVTTSLGK